MVSRLVVLLLTLWVTQSSVGQEIVGDWAGNLSVQGTKVPLVFHIQKAEEGYSGTMDSPSQGALGLGCDEVTFDGKSVSILMNALGIKYKGQFEGDSIMGEFIQGGNALPLNLGKTDVEEPTYNRPQEPKPKFAYAIEEVKFFNSKDSIWLSGTLTYPKSTGPFAAVVLSSGSGPSDRNEEIFKHKPFLLIADYLTYNGIAVLRFDDRGVGSSEGDYSSATLEDFASDVIAGVQYVKARKEIDSTRVGVLGHSEGGALALMAASKESLKGIILLAGITMQGDELMLLQKKKMEEAMGVPPMAIASGQLIFGKVYAILRSEVLSEEEKVDSVATYLDGQLGGLMEESQVDALVKQITSNEFMGIIQFNPDLYWSKINCNVLALFGEMDLQVLPEEGAQAVKEALKEHKLKGKVVVVDGVNHLFQECETGLLSEYIQIEQTLKPEVLEILLKWVKKNL